MVCYECFSGLGQLGQSSVSMSGFGQSLGQLNQSSGLSPALPISTAAASTVYQAHYGLNSLGKSKPKTVNFYGPTIGNKK